ncbi:MAG TPA: NAD-dependent epimerase/dehydratase family protein [Candidatus Lumbricidophila sp.]|nr:NAD-dependent epimerase/dehydratase family protein [Candidatus Lumbricidophila sp.]
MQPTPPAQPGHLVVITGGSGFVGAHCIVAALAAGYRVRTTVRSLDRSAAVRALVEQGGADASGLEFAEANLLADDGWRAAFEGARSVLHVASPFPARQPKNPDDVIVPARDGALRALRAARAAGVERVVLTSSFAAVGYGGEHPGRPFTEADWTDGTNTRLSPYVRSKAIAERAAWDFIAEHGGVELATVNPVGIFGPVLGRDLSASVELLLALLNGAIPAVPNGSASGVDVRDVADLHLRAMVHPDAAGHRFLAVSGDPFTFPELAALLRDRLGDAAARVPRTVLPNWLARALAPFSADLRSVVTELGHPRSVSADQARTLLGWDPRPRDEAILASVASLRDLGMLRAGA